MTNKNKGKNKNKNKNVPVPTVAAKQADTAAEQPGPVAEQASPAAEQASPAAEQTSPAAEQARPAAEQARPAAEQTSPAAEQATPSDASLPAEQASPAAISDCKAVDKTVSFKEEPAESTLDQITAPDPASGQAMPPDDVTGQVSCRVEPPDDIAGEASTPEDEEAKKRAIADAGYKRLCSDATLQSKKDGYFKTYSSQVVQSITEDQFEEFKKLTTDEERVFFVWGIPAVHSTVTVRPFSRKKSAKAAEDLKEQGNKHFQNKKYRQAVCDYSQSVIRAPNPGDSDGGELLSLSYANRSAALLHMGEHRLCLRDIEAALAAGYPARLRYKLLDRRATCQLKLGEVSAARASLQELKAALEIADLDEKKRAVWERDVQKKIESIANMQDFKPITQHVESEIPELPSRSERFLSASAAVDVAFAPEEGRYAVAAEPVRPGDLLVVEKPHASVLMSEKLGTHCSHCLKRVLAAYPCRDCSGVLFCSPECAAAASYHRWECSILDVLQASGMSPLCHLALRLVTKHGLEFFKQLRPELARRRDPAARPATDPEGRVYDPSDYRSVHQLVTLAELRKPEDFFHRTLMAVLLLKHLRVTGFFGQIPDEDVAARPLTSDELLVGSLLLHHLQLLQFNAHEVGEYVMMEPGQYKQSRSVYTGVAVYPTVSFFNHSCEGGVSRCFVGDTLIVHSVHPLASGDHIFENYGPTYTHKALKDRQHWLSSRYWFDCRCVACVEDWPDYDEHDYTKVSLRCQGCGAGIVNDATGKNANGDCPSCGKKNNAVELFRQLRSAQELYQSAMRIMDEGEPRKALRLFYRFIDQCQSLVTKPNRDLSLCQEAARMCLASLGSLHYIRNKK